MKYISKLAFAIVLSVTLFACSDEEIALESHLGCASVDWTGIGAPLCHGAVIIMQIAASDTCNAEAENCLKDNGK